MKPLFLMAALLAALLISTCTVPSSPEKGKGGAAPDAGAKAANGIEKMPTNWVLCCPAGNDLFSVLQENGMACQRFDDAMEAVDAAPEGGGLLVLAGRYPEETLRVDETFFVEADRKELRIYLEYPHQLPAMEVGEIRRAARERAVVSSSWVGPGLEPLRILAIHDCHFVPVEAEGAHLVAAKVAGFDQAVFGLPDTQYPLLFEHPRGNLLVATTKLSQFVTARYAPREAWETVWERILAWLEPDHPPVNLSYHPLVRPAYGRDDPLPTDAERTALERGSDWFFNAGMILSAGWKKTYEEEARNWPERVGPAPTSGTTPGNGGMTPGNGDTPPGNGDEGVLEGFCSRIRWDGSQPIRWWRRSDCNGEVAGALALSGLALRDEQKRLTSERIGDFLHSRSIMSSGERADPEHPAFGLIGWNDVKNYHGNLDGFGVYYGDDNARNMLGTFAAAGVLGIDRWNPNLARCVLANLRTTGPLGFRGNRIDEGPLERQGWRPYFEQQRVNLAPHFEAYLWACYLFANHHTKDPLLLNRARTAIRMTMEAYPEQWRWTNGMQQERARMLLPLAWLVRVEDTAEHRRWLRRVASDLLEHQHESGAIGETLGPEGRGLYPPPGSNEAYGASEASILQENGDPVCDLLYTVAFAFLGLHEAAAATGEALYREGEDRLARFLCRIQVRSEARPELDGAWFRAFDFNRWEHWASNADAGWGAWCVETGWTQAWILAVLALRGMETSLWNMGMKCGITEDYKKYRSTMLPGEGEAEEITLNEKETGYRGIWYMNQPSNDEYLYKYSGGLGTYCAKHNPFAVYCKEVDMTFFCYGGGKPDDNRRLVHMVSCFDHKTGTVPRPTLLLDKQTGDAHDNPVISVDDAGYLWIFSTSHGTSRPSYIHRSEKPYDIERFERIAATRRDGDRQVPMDNFSYMQAWHVPRKGFICFFTRYGYPADRTICCMTSPDGVQWSAWQRLASIEKGHYQISAVGRSRAGSAFNFHPADKGLNWRSNLYYVETADFGKTWRTVDGTALTLPLQQADNPALVQDYRSAGLNVYLKDICYDAKDRPVILYLTSKGYESGPKNDPRTWRIARWTGEQWAFHAITTSDNNYDMGSLWMTDDSTWHVIAPTETGPQPYNTGGEVVHWISNDEGSTWKKAEQLTFKSKGNHTYVRRPVNAHPGFFALWADGHGRKPSESRLYFSDLEGKVFVFPREMTEAHQKPALLKTN